MAYELSSPARCELAFRLPHRDWRGGALGAARCSRPGIAGPEAARALCGSVLRDEQQRRLGIFPRRPGGMQGLLLVSFGNSRRPLRLRLPGSSLGISELLAGSALAFSPAAPRKSSACSRDTSAGWPHGVSPTAQGSVDLSGASKFSRVCDGLVRRTVAQLDGGVKTCH